MANTGSPYLIPYMIDGDPLAVVAERMQELAERMEFLQGQRGIASPSLAGVSVGSVTVTFDVPFDVPPLVFATTQNNTLMLATVELVSETYCKNGVRHVKATSVSGTYNVGWLALPDVG